MSILYLINTQAVDEQNVFTTDLRFCCRVEGVQSKALIKKDIHYKGDVGQSIMPNKQLQATFNSQTPFFHHLISVHRSSLLALHTIDMY